MDDGEAAAGQGYVEAARQRRYPAPSFGVEAAIGMGVPFDGHAIAGAALDNRDAWSHYQGRLSCIVANTRALRLRLPALHLVECRSSVQFPTCVDRTSFQGS